MNLLIDKLLHKTAEPKLSALVKYGFVGSVSYLMNFTHDSAISNNF